MHDEQDLDEPKDGTGTAQPSADSQPPVLPVGYYADNFRFALDTAFDSYTDLLTDAETAFYRNYLALSLAARRLYVRLISRSGPCLRRDKLAYDEIPRLDEALTELQKSGFVDGGIGESGEDASASELLPLLLKAELVELIEGLLGPEVAQEPPFGARKSRKLELQLAALTHIDHDLLADAVRQRLEIVRPLMLEHVTIFRLLFFGNLHQDWTEFVLRDLGVLRFESYELRRDLRMFTDRQSLEHSRDLRLARSAVGRLLHLGERDAALEIAAQVLQQIDHWHSSTRRYADRVLNDAGRALERASQWQEALDFYAAARTPPARERRCRVLQRLEQLEPALELCQEMEAAPLDETERSFAPFFGHKLRRQLGHKVGPWRRPKRPIGEMEIERQADQSVERQVLAALAEDGRRGIHSENWLWQSLFGLAFWDIIFAPVAGAFHHPFQYGPLDLSNPDFRSLRQPAIKRRLDELHRETDLAARLLPICQQKQGIANRLVHWHSNLETELRWVLEFVRGPHLAIFSERLSRHLGRYRRGLPDLFVVAPDSPAGFELLEVKAPGDQLRPEQGTWIDYLNRHGIPASILRVRWA